MTYSDPTHRLLDHIATQLKRIADAMDKPGELEFTLTDPPKQNNTPKRRHEYEPEFEELWNFYPARNGSNPKWKAQQCWRARIKSASLSHRQTALEEINMLEGVKRYATWCQATGKTGTEMVMQATRFLGPGREYEAKWDAPTPDPDVIKLPRDNDELVKFAVGKGLAPRVGENWWDFRRRVEDAL